ncbi:hypothetical protein [Methylicorpusculum sp.]|uniref:hypothetical protein n=1 Tax=Methylicorpusculum sp. TaxID=2713644 RepID=UPI002AB9B889|nr:hypothetical protein [Methylicorpusculum sp.]MDZ4152483.1 hypothetical protein [Methylicorpusculum sp.]
MLGWLSPTATYWLHHLCFVVPLNSFKENNSFQDGFTGNSQFEGKKGLGEAF